ncbi:substrate-binding domain-containing protein [Clostridium sp. AN503]|uniref:substrate-binding domain-containing protein n=1 Tax=Clostridium sp. AN503 TaxID=3160598 RepID=UPI003459C3B4
MKKTLAMILTMGMIAASLTACGGSNAETKAATEAATTAGSASDQAADEAGSEAGNTTAAEAGNGAGAAKGPITVVSREDGSGTRGAFIELFGIEEKNDAGEKVDNTTEDAEITNSTSVMMTTISGNDEAIGYISLGSLNDTVKAVKIDGAEATVDNIKSGAYKISRPFNIATKEGLSDVAADFIKYIMSEDGQKVVEENGYISQGNEGAYTASGLKGKVVVAGSSSVSPVMEKLKEAYVALNPDVTVEVQQSDSTTGMTSAIEGVCDIGMASRELKESETSAGLTPSVIAMDGIAVIVNNDSPVQELTSDNVKSIFTGEVTDWEDVK